MPACKQLILTAPDNPPINQFMATNPITPNQLFLEVDLNVNGALEVEEIFAVRSFHETRVDIAQFAKEITDIPVDALIAAVQRGIADIEKSQTEHPLHASPILAPFNPSDPAHQKYAYRIISRYLDLPRGSLRELYLTRLLACRQISESELQFSKDFLEQAPSISGLFSRIELCDGRPGLSRDEYQKFKPAIEAKSVPSLRIASRFSFDSMLSTFDAQRLKKNVVIEDADFKKKVFFLIDHLASSPTGAKVLRALMEKTEGQGIKIRLLTPQDTEALSGGQNMGIYLKEEGALALNPFALQGAETTDQIASWVETLGHEMFHAVISRGKSNEPTITEETLAHRIAQLIFWELGLTLKKVQTRTLMSPAAQVEFIRNSYLMLYYAQSTPQEFRDQESRFNPGEWENYVKEQTQGIFEMGLKACQ